jgi:hypothetical protein
MAVAVLAVQSHPVPVTELFVKPLGNVSVTVTAPLVA